MSVLYQMLDQIRNMARETEEEIALIEAGKLAIICQGYDYTEHRLLELIARLAKLKTTIEKFD